MRDDRLILLIIVLLVACKARVHTPVSTYSEDLSIHRPLPVVEIEEEVEVVEKNETYEVPQEEYKPLTGHIKAELDSIAKIVYFKNKSGKYVDGFVIQAYLGNSREEANTIKTDMDTFFPELNPRVTYRQPNFRVKAGKFLNRLEAYKIYNEVKTKFSKAILIPERYFLIYE